jgi:outer membrane protein assembly factor BamB
MAIRNRVISALLLLLIPLGVCATAGVLENTTTPLSAWARTTTESVSDNAEEVHLVWSFRQRRPASGSAEFGTRSSFSHLVTDGTMTFTILNDTLFGIDVASGQLRWKRTLPAHPATDLLVDNGTVFVGFPDTILATDALSGADRWRVSSPTSYRSGMVIDGSRLFRMNNLGMLVALDNATGTELWSTGAGGGQTSPASAGFGRIIVASQPPSRGDLGRMSAFDAETGTRIWSRDLGTGTFGHPVMSADTIYVGFSSYRQGSLARPGREEPVLVALDALTGEQRWSLRTRTVLKAPLLTENGLLYAVDEDQWSIDNPRYSMTILSINAVTGELLWDRATDSMVSRGAPVVRDGFLYVSATYGDFVGLYAVDAGSGDEIWRRRVGDAVTTAPIVAGHLLMVATTLGDDARIDALAAGQETKTLGWQLVAGFVVISGAGGLAGLLARRTGGKWFHISPSVLASPWKWVTPIPLAFVMTVLVNGTVGFMTAWLVLTVVAIMEVLGRVPVARRRRFLAVFWLWTFLTLAVSADLTNARLGPLALFDHPERMLALGLLATACGFAILAATGGFDHAGWTWPASAAIGWLAAVVAAALVIAWREGSAGYLDAWRLLLGERSREGFMSASTPAVLGNADLAMFALVGAGLMMAAGMIAWAVGAAPLRHQLRQVSFLLPATFAAAAATGALSDSALTWWLWALPVGGLVIGIIVRSRLALALVIGFGYALTTGTVAGLLLARGLVHAWEAPACDWLSPCTPAEIGAGVVGIVLLSLLLALAGIGFGRLLDHVDRTMHHHPV